MTQDTQIKYRPDGSIDTAFYMERGRYMRSLRAHEMLRGAPEARERKHPRGLAALFAF